MNRKFSLQSLCAAALLIAMGVVIPMFSPLKVILEPASFTLASHVAIFIAMMISPQIAVSVAVGTTLGFFMGGFPIVVVLRAATHLVFSLAGSLYLKNHTSILNSGVRAHVFSFVIGVLHGVCEVLVVSSFYFVGGMGAGYYQAGFARAVLLLVGVGSLIHSMVDFEISLVIVKVLQKHKNFSLHPKSS